jgi:hypothetical protein
MRSSGALNGRFSAMRRRLLADYTTVRGGGPWWFESSASQKSQLEEAV